MKTYDWLTEDVVAAFRKHAEDQFPRESCGLVIIEGGKPTYVPCRNIAVGTEHFVLSPEDFGFADDRGDVVAVVHSHPGLPPTPSQADLVSAEGHNYPWVIVNWPTGEYLTFEPSGYVAPLVGRQFSFGVLDCFTLIRDYYKRELDIDIEDFPRQDEWWKKGQNLYLDNYDKAGFIVANDGPQKHDIILMQVARSAVPNHGAIYLGDDYILHHLYDHLSGRDLFTGYWAKCATHILRHRTLWKRQPSF